MLGDAIVISFWVRSCAANCGTHDIAFTIVEACFCSNCNDKRNKSDSSRGAGQNKAVGRTMLRVAVRPARYYVSIRSTH
jgi:hypothetical protein